MNFGVLEGVRDVLGVLVEIGDLVLEQGGEDRVLERIRGKREGPASCLLVSFTFR